MRRSVSALLCASILLAGCASNRTLSPEAQALYPHPPGSMGNPNAQKTLIVGVGVVLLSAVLIHSLRDR